MATCVRAFATNVSAARRLHHVSLLSSTLWGGGRCQARPIQPQKGHCWGPAKRWHRPSLHRRMTIVATVTSESNSAAIFYADAGISRATEMRVDATKLSQAFHSPEALVVPLMGTQNLVKEGKPVLIAASALQTNDADHASAGDPVFLGLSNSTQAPVFAVNVAELCSTGGERPAWEEGGDWIDVRRYGPQLRASDAGLLAYARGMVEWQSRNMYCGRCGARMVAKDGGHSLHCFSDSCKNSAYPRLDPAVIMLITCGNFVLLGRQSRWNPGRYSLLAGFVEIGETFEMAVTREVKEESGIDVDVATVSYAASQPWPFPSSLMVGFNAAAVKNQCAPYDGVSGIGDAVPVAPEKLCGVVDEVNALPRTTADNNELEDARWVHKDFVRWVLEEKPLPHGVVFSIPGKYAIAHVLLKRWAATGSGAPRWAGHDIKSVEIDEGVFKYVLMCIRDDEGHEKLIVRGSTKLAYHSDILEATQKEVRNAGLEVSQLGGGRIDHDAGQRKLHVFSISQAYGPADHTVTCALLKQWFPLHSISLSRGG